MLFVASDHIPESSKAIYSFSGLSAAKSLCMMREWQINNVTLHKVLYLAQMIHIGIHGVPMIKETFESTSYGPLLPELFKKLRMYGSQPIPNRGFLKDQEGLNPSSEAYMG